MIFRWPDHPRYERREKAARGPGWNEDLIPVCECRISLVLHAFHDAHDFPGRFTADRELTTHDFLRRAKSGCKSLIDDSNLGTGTHFAVFEFATVLDPSAHG